MEAEGDALSFGRQSGAWVYGEGLGVCMRASRGWIVWRMAMWAMGAAGRRLSRRGIFVYSPQEPWRYLKGHGFSFGQGWRRGWQVPTLRLNSRLIVLGSTPIRRGISHCVCFQQNLNLISLLLGKVFVETHIGSFQGFVLANI